jgi:RNA polymerase sigma-70 factor (ECF subfamily)
MADASVDRGQLDELVARHHGEIYRYLLLVTGRVADARALSQETFVRALGACAPPTHVTAARRDLFAIATELSRSGRRPRQRRAGRCPGRAAGNEAHQHPLAVAIARLPVPQRIALALRKLHGFDYDGIGGMLGCSSQGARERVMRAFRRLGRMRSLTPVPGSLA